LVQGSCRREENSKVSKTPAKPVARPAAKKAAAKPEAAVKTAVSKKAPVKPIAKSAPPAAASRTPATRNGVAAAPTVSPTQVARSSASSPAGKKASPAPSAVAKAPSPGTAPLSKSPVAPKPVSEAPPPKPPPKPLTRLKAAKQPPAPVEYHPPSVPLPPPSRPPPSNVIDLPRPARKIDPKLANVWKSKAGRDLTDDELMAMPDSEYMNEKQLEFFRTKLMQQRNDLLDNAGETTEHLREDTSIVPDPADRATIEEEHALELRTRDRERKLLKKISQSIARIEAGDYGYCDETGEPIGLGRLLARPTATLSLEAQQRREMKQKMFGD
jgi:DnaK suppressor protein